MAIDKQIPDLLEDEPVSGVVDCEILRLQWIISSLCLSLASPLSKSLTSQLQQFGLIARWQYLSSFDTLIAFFDPLAQSFMQRLVHGPMPRGDREAQIIEGDGRGWISRVMLIE